MKLVPRKCLNMADVTDVITWWLKTGQIGTEVERCTIKGRASPNTQWTTETRWSGSNRVLQHSGAGCPTTTCCFKTLLMRILMWCQPQTAPRGCQVISHLCGCDLIHSVQHRHHNCNTYKLNETILSCGWWLHVCKTDHLLKRFQMNNYMHNNVEKY